MVDFVIKDPDTGKIMMRLKNPPSKARILKMFDSFITPSGKLIAEEPIEIWEGEFEEIETGKIITRKDKDGNDIEIIEKIIVKKMVTKIPIKKISDFFPSKNKEVIE